MGEPTEIGDEELNEIERECATLIRYDGPGGMSSDVLRLIAALRSTRERLAAAEDLLREVFDEFGPGCRDFSTWDTVEDFLARPEPEEAPRVAPTDSPKGDG